MTVEFERLDLDDALELAGIIRRGELLERRVEALKLLGSIIGGLGVLLENRGVFGDPATDVGPMSLEQCAVELEAQLSSETSTISPVLIAIITRMVKLLIEELLK